jgi:hypothetical protein
MRVPRDSTVDEEALLAAVFERLRTRYAYGAATERALLNALRLHSGVAVDTVSVQDVQTLPEEHAVQVIILTSSEDDALSIERTVDADHADVVAACKPSPCTVAVHVERTSPGCVWPLSLMAFALLPLGL